MSCVRYKFKSSLEYDKITFEGLQLSVGDLRKKIMSQKKLGLSDDFTLQIMDAQTKKSEEVFVLFVKLQVFEIQLASSGFPSFEEITEFTLHLLFV